MRLLNYYRAACLIGLRSVQVERNNAAFDLILSGKTLSLRYQRNVNDNILFLIIYLDRTLAVYTHSNSFVFIMTRSFILYVFHKYIDTFSPFFEIFMKLLKP